MLALFLSSFAALISVVNPLGAVPVFLSMTPAYSVSERRYTALQASLYFLLILMAFFWGGSYILSFFGIGINALRVAGGLVILSSGVALLNGKFSESRAIDSKVKKEALQKEDISFSPLAMPLLSGPGSISLLIALYKETADLTAKFVISGSIFATSLIILLILVGSPLLFKVLGRAGLKAISRIMGFIVIAIGVQYVIAGIVSEVTKLL